MIKYALLIYYLYSINTIICKGNSWITGGNNHLKSFLLLQWIMHKISFHLFFPFFIKVVVNKSKAYSFLIIVIMHLQKILLSVIMLRFYFFTAKQGTWVHNFDRGPLCSLEYQLFVWKPFLQNHKHVVSRNSSIVLMSSSEYLLYEPGCTFAKYFLL